MSTTARKSRLAGAMAKKAALDGEETPAPPLVLAAAPVEEPEGDDAEGLNEAVPRAHRHEAAPSREPEPVAPSPEAGPEVAPVPVQRASVLAGVGQAEELADPDLIHLRRVIATGRDQRRYVEALPRRSDRGTYVRLPVHLQDTLAEYCDRDSAPMADFVTALLDAYFRDIGALPPLGEGNRPRDDFFDRLRREQRAYDY